MFLKSITGEPAHVAFISGHSIVVPPEGREIPPVLVSDALRSGKVVAADSVQASPAPVDDSLQGGKIERIKAAITAALDTGDESFMTAKGVPDARKLDKLVGEPVSTAERDQAWAEIQAEIE